MDEHQLVTIGKALNTPGEHLFSLTGPAGPIEVTLTLPEDVDKRYLAILGHPHSLQGGTMNNKVVTTLARTFKELHISSLRFNFRGVGQTGGVYDNGIGESEDMLFLARQFLQVMPDVRFMFAGFSFGSYVAYRAASQYKHALLVTVAPPVHHFDYTEFSPAPAPWIVVQGDEDDVAPLQLVLNFIAQTSPSLPLLRFAETGHFFHGKLIELKSRLIEAIRAQVNVL